MLRQNEQTLRGRPNHIAVPVRIFASGRVSRTPAPYQSRVSCPARILAMKPCKRMKWPLQQYCITWGKGPREHLHSRHSTSGQSPGKPCCVPTLLLRIKATSWSVLLRVFSSAWAPDLAGFNTRAEGSLRSLDEGSAQS